MIRCLDEHAERERLAILRHFARRARRRERRRRVVYALLLWIRS